MKIKTNEYGAIECFENTFVAGASGWGLNVIDLYFAPQRTLPLTVDRVVYSFKRADGVTIGRLEATLTSENVDTTLGAECYRYEIKDSDGVLGVAGALGISAELLHVVLNDDDEVIDLQKIATIRCAANVYNNVAIEDIEDYNALAVMVDGLSNLLAAYNTRLNEMRGELDDIEPGAEVNVIETVKVNNTALTVTDKAVNVTVPTQAALDGKVDKVDGKGLSTNDYTTVDKTKLASIEEGAEVNVIETVKVNGVALTPISKAVDITNVAKTNEFNDFTHKQTFYAGVEITGHTIINGYLMGNAIDAKGHVSIIDANELGAVTLLPQPGIANVNRTVTIPFKSGTLALTSDIPTTANEVGALPDTTLYGATIDLSYTANTGVLGLTLKDQNGNTLNSDMVDLPLELLIQSGSVQTCITANVPVNGYVVGDKYIDLVLANSEHIYVLVSDLVDQVTITETGTGNAVTDITVSGNVITKTKGKEFVEKETGKGLSTNDYTNDEKAKLTNIAENAQVNVQSDWNEADTNSDAYIKNKPSVAKTDTANVFSQNQTITTKLLIGSQMQNGSLELVKNFDDEGALNSAKTLIKPTSTINNTEILLPDSAGTLALTSDIPTQASDIGAIPTTEKGAANGVAELDENGKVPLLQLPSGIGGEGKVDREYSTDYEYTDGLVFTFVTDHYIIGDNSETNGNGYTGTATNIIIPKYYDDGVNGVAKVTRIGRKAFYGKTDIISVIIPNSITSIGYKAFFNCPSLTTINIPNSVTSIGQQAFSYCELLTSIIIPNSVTSIGLMAFDNCVSLKEITFTKSTPPTLNTSAFDNSGITATTGAIYVPYESLEAYKTATNWATYAAVIYPIPEGKWIMEEMPKQVTYTATLPSASWTGTSAPYSKAVTVSGILATDIPDIDLDLSSVAYANIAAMQTDWAKVYRAETSTDTITFFASEVPSADIPLQIKVVR